MIRTGPCAIPRLLATAGSLLLAASLAACDSSGSDVVRPAASGPSAASSPPSTPAPVTSGPSSPPSTAHGQPAVRLTPHAGLHDRQLIQVLGTGFTPGQPYTVVECAQKGAKTGPGDCNLPGMLTATADQDGAVRVRVRVLAGPFGANRIVCSARQPCLISVTQASLSPTEEADGSITFAP